MSSRPHFRIRFRWHPNAGCLHAFACTVLVFFSLAASKPAHAAEAEASRRAVEGLTEYLATDVGLRQPLAQQPFASSALTRQDAADAKQLLWQDRLARLRKSRAEEMEARELKDGDLRMPFFYKVFGDKPADGRSLYISMHGGGGAPKRVNDGQWENQKRLYSLKEGVYVAPRAATDTWNLWHQAHIDRLFDRLIERPGCFRRREPRPRVPDGLLRRR